MKVKDDMKSQNIFSLPSVKGIYPPKQQQQQQQKTSHLGDTDIFRLAEMKI